MLELNSGHGRPTIDLLRGGAPKHPRSPAVDVELFCGFDPNPILKSYRSYLGPAFANHQPKISNTPLVWCMFLPPPSEVFSSEPRDELSKLVDR